LFQCCAQVCGKRLHLHAQKARVPLLSVQNSYKLPSGNTDYSPVDIVLFGTDPVASFIAQRRDPYNLQPGDTVAVNYSAYLYLKQ
jgi:hypothetical protein